MTYGTDRRSFLQASTMAVAGIAARAVSGLASQAEGGSSGKWYRKAVGYPMIEEGQTPEDKLRVAKEAGFEGIETPSHLLKQKTPEPQILARASEKVGIPIHGVVNSSNPDLRAAIDEAVLYGATSVLHVVRADPEGSFMANYHRTQETIRQAIPYAEKKRVYLLIENVWATFLTEPLTMARYIDELNSPWVQAYFDVGNVMRWGVPQHWIEVLGRRIKKIHIKEYNLKVAMGQGMAKGFDFPIGEGSIDWKRVCGELKKIGYHGWATAEVAGGDRRRLAEIAQQMDHVLSL